MRVLVDFRWLTIALITMGLMVCQVGAARDCATSDNEPSQEEPSETTGPGEIPLTGVALEGLEAFDRLVVPFMKRWEMRGGAVALAKDGRLVLARGYGFKDEELGESVQPDSLFRLASLSKPITAVAILRLVEERRLKLDDKVLEILRGTHWEAGAPLDARWNEITLRQLLQHTGGWDREKSFDPMFRSRQIAVHFDAAPPATTPQILEYMLARSLDFGPGERYA